MTGAYQSLPFVQQPAVRDDAWAEVGNEQVGILRFPRHGFLLVGEQDLIAEADPTNSIYVETCRIANVVAAAEGWTPTEAYATVTRIQSSAMGVRVLLTPEEHDARIRHAALFGPLVRHVIGLSNLLTLRRCTAVIRYRLEGCSDWSDDDTRALPGALRDAIHSFEQAEEAAMAGIEPQDVEAQLAQLEVDLGKLPPAHSMPPQPAGSKRSGAARSSTPATAPSPVKRSRSSRSPSSLKPSTEVSAGGGSSSTGQS
jgi:hypothetical protein